MTSTINRTIPASHAALQSLVIRDNFNAAANDIEALQVAGGIDPRNYGAKFDGVTDDTVAWQAAIDAINPAAPQPIIFVGGISVVSAQLVAVDRPLSIVGGGIGVSILRWSLAAVTRGILLTSNNVVRDKLTIRNLSLRTYGVGVGTAIKCDYSGAISAGNIQPRYVRTVIVENIDMEGATSALVDGWQHGFHGVSLLGGNISCCMFTGLRGATPDDVLSGNGFMATGAGSATEFSISDCYAYFADNAVYSEDLEGTQVTGGNFVAVNKGVYINNAVDEPGAFVADTHINAFVGCIHAVNVSQFNVHDNLLYGRDDAVAPVFGVKVTGNLGRLHHNHYVSPTVAMDAIVLLDAQNYNIFGEYFQNVRDGINCDATSTNTFATDISSATVTGAFWTSANNSSVITSGKVRLELTGAGFVVADSSATLVAWDSEITDNFNFFSSGTPTIMTITRAGVYRISAQLVYPNDVVGIRRAIIQGSTLGIISNDNENAVTGAFTTVVNLNSPPTQIALGEQIAVQAFQTSGGPLTLAGGAGNCYVQLEYLGPPI